MYGKFKELVGSLDLAPRALAVSKATFDSTIDRMTVLMSLVDSTLSLCYTYL